MASERIARNIVNYVTDVNGKNISASNPTFNAASDIERLYDDLQQLFDWLQPQVTGMTLAAYAQHKHAQRRSAQPKTGDTA